MNGKLQVSTNKSVPTKETKLTFNLILSSLQAKVRVQPK